MADSDRRKAAMERIARELMDQGLIVEGGWQMFRLIALAPDAPTSEQDRCKEAFFSGAQHLFGAIMSALEPGDEPTDPDLRRMDQIHLELEVFGNQLRLKYGRSMGSA